MHDLLQNSSFLERLHSVISAVLPEISNTLSAQLNYSHENAQGQHTRNCKTKRVDLYKNLYQVSARLSHSRNLIPYFLNLHNNNTNRSVSALSKRAINGFFLVMCSFQKKPNQIFLLILDRWFASYIWKFWLRQKVLISKTKLNRNCIDFFGFHRPVIVCIMLWEPWVKVLYK